MRIEDRGLRMALKKWRSAILYLPSSVRAIRSNEKSFEGLPKSAGHLPMPPSVRLKVVSSLALPTAISRVLPSLV